jgi:hypothetical protein
VPHGPAAKLGSGWLEPAAAAKTESFLSSAVEWQLGQTGTVLARTSASNSWPQSWQAYSKIGMGSVLLTLYFESGCAARVAASSNIELNQSRRTRSHVGKVHPVARAVRDRGQPGVSHKIAGVIWATPPLFPLGGAGAHNERLFEGIPWTTGADCLHC